MKIVKPKTHVTAAPGKNLYDPANPGRLQLPKGKAPRPLDPQRRTSR